MSGAEPTWDTEEAWRWISNVEPLYLTAERVSSASALRVAFEEHYPSGDLGRCIVNTRAVDWEYLFTEIKED